MLVFVNYAHFYKNAELDYASTEFGKNTSITICTKQVKVQTHSPYLHLETSTVHNLLSDDYKD